MCYEHNGHAMTENTSKPPRNPLRIARIGKGWTQQHVASMVGVDQSRIARYEAGAPASPVVARSLAQLFGGAVSELDLLYPDRSTSEATA
jgi:transcriptional regulator with XRE-family HTH domain